MTSVLGYCLEWDSSLGGIMRKSILIFLLMWVSPAAFSASFIDSPSEKFLAVSDIHFNPFSTCSVSIKPCPVIQALRQADPHQWSAILQQEHDSIVSYGKDTNYALFDSALAEFKRLSRAQQPQFVVVLGDLLAHHYKENFALYSSDDSVIAYHDFVKKTLQFISIELTDIFPMTDIYSAIGNNDSYGDDYQSDLPGGDFFRETGETWSHLLREPTEQSVMRDAFSRSGYYAITQSGLKIIVLNTSLFSPKATGESVMNEAKAQLVWLHTQLADAHTCHEKVMIIMHIPDEMDVFNSLNPIPLTWVEFWRADITNTFQSEVSTYASDIVGMFAGHLHADWFQVLQQTVPVVGIPAISPQFGNNPGFKLIEMDASSKTLLNSQTYYFRLNDTHQWEMEYDFNAVYQPKGQTGKMVDGMNALSVDNLLAASYRRNYSLSTTSQPISDNSHWLAYWCVVHHASKEEYSRCRMD